MQKKIIVCPESKTCYLRRAPGQRARVVIVDYVIDCCLIRKGRGVCTFKLVIRVHYILVK